MRYDLSLNNSLQIVAKSVSERLIIWFHYLKFDHGFTHKCLYWRLKLCDNKLLKYVPSMVVSSLHCLRKSYTLVAWIVALFSLEFVVVRCFIRVFWSLYSLLHSLLFPPFWHVGLDVLFVFCAARWYFVSCPPRSFRSSTLPLIWNF